MLERENAIPPKIMKSRYLSPPGFIIVSRRDCVIAQIGPRADFVKDSIELGSDDIRLTCVSTVIRKTPVWA